MSNVPKVVGVKQQTRDRLYSELKDKLRPFTKAVPGKFEAGRRQAMKIRRELASARRLQDVWDEMEKGQ